MLNNKKNLLQRVQIAMVAIVMVMGVGGAYAMNAPKTHGLVTYAVLSTNANTYSVTTNIMGTCDNTTKHCIVRSSQPVTDGTIPKAGAENVQSGQFTPAP